MLAEALAQMRQYREALGPIVRALELCDDASEMATWLHAYRAMALCGSGRVTEAVDAFSAVREPAASDPAVVAWHERARLAHAESAAAGG